MAQLLSCLGGAEAKHLLAALAIASVSPSAWAADAQAANSWGEKRSANGASDDKAALRSSVGDGSDAWTGVKAGSSGSGWLMFIVFVSALGLALTGPKRWLGAEVLRLALSESERCGGPFALPPGRWRR